MEKKQYIAPSMEEMEMEIVEVIATSIPFIDEEGTDQLSNAYRPERRGKWGDLWYVEEQ